MRDDPENGLNDLGSPTHLATSGFPGEVAVAPTLGPISYSTDYGVTWKQIAHSLGPDPIYWAHAGKRSVLVEPTGDGMFLADMTAAQPTFIKMTKPYAPPARDIGVGNAPISHGLQPWTPAAICRCTR